MGDGGEFGDCGSKVWGGVCGGWGPELSDVRREYDEDDGGRSKGRKTSAIRSFHTEINTITKRQEPPRMVRYTM